MGSGTWYMDFSPLYSETRDFPSYNYLTLLHMRTILSAQLSIGFLPGVLL